MTAGACMAQSGCAIVVGEVGISAAAQKCLRNGTLFDIARDPCTRQLNTWRDACVQSSAGNIANTDCKQAATSVHDNSSNDSVHNACAKLLR